MDNPVKSGKEILADFFNHLSNIPNVDKKLALAIKEMYESERLSSTNLSNKLLSLREEEIDDKN